MSKKILMLAGRVQRGIRDIRRSEQGHRPLSAAMSCMSSVPARRRATKIKTSLHDFEGDQTYTEKPGHLRTLNRDVHQGRAGILRCGLRRGRARASTSTSTKTCRGSSDTFTRSGKPYIFHDLPRGAGADGGQGCLTTSASAPALEYCEPEITAVGGTSMSTSPQAPGHVDGNLVSAKGWRARRVHAGMSRRARHQDHPFVTACPDPLGIGPAA